MQVGPKSLLLRGRQLLKDALIIVQQRYHPIVARILISLGDAYRALGDAARQKTSLECALAIAHGKNQLEVATILMNLGNAYGNLGETTQQKDLLERARGIYHQHFPNGHPRLTKIEEFLKQLRLELNSQQPFVLDTPSTRIFNLEAHTKSNLETAQQKGLLERALINFGQSDYGKSYPKVVKALESLRDIHVDLCEAAQQKTLSKSILTIVERFITYPGTIALILAQLGKAYEALGASAQQKDLLEGALNIIQHDYPDYDIKGRGRGEAIVLGHLGNAYVNLGEVAKGKALLERALNISKLHYGRGHVEVAKILAYLANAYVHLNEAANGKGLLERALVIFEHHGGKDDITVAITLGNLALVHEALDERTQQKDVLERALAIFENSYDKDHVEVGKVLEGLGNAYVHLDEADKGKALLERARGIYNQHFPEGHLNVTKIEKYLEQLRKEKLSNQSLIFSTTLSSHKNNQSKSENTLLNTPLIDSNRAVI